MDLEELITALQVHRVNFGNIPVALGLDDGLAILPIATAGVADVVTPIGKQRLCILFNSPVGVCQGCPTCKTGLNH